MKAHSALDSEEELLTLAVLHRALRGEFQKIPDGRLNFIDPFAKECCDFLKKNPDMEFQDILGVLSAPAAQWLSAAVMRLEQIQDLRPEEIFGLLLKNIEEKNLDREIHGLEKQVTQSLNQGDLSTHELQLYKDQIRQRKGFSKDRKINHVVL